MGAKFIQSLLRRVDQRAVSDAAKIESRNREVHLPPVSVYRWWARRTEAVNGALLDAAASELNRKKKLLVADPFAGGGVIPLAALKRGHKIYAQDLNPWVTKGLAVTLGLPSEAALREGAERLLASAQAIAREAYGTTFSDDKPAQTSHAMRVAISRCSACGYEHAVFPHALVTLIKRKEHKGHAAILACRNGHLFRRRHDRGAVCAECGDRVDPARSYVEKRIVACPACGHGESLNARASSGSWRWELALVERSDGQRRELGMPTQAERKKASDENWKAGPSLGKILGGAQEVRVLTRHGFRFWHDLYPRRQRHVTRQLLRFAREASDDARVVDALTMAVLGTTEMAGMLSRWDRYYLKSYEAMASHRFNFSTLVAEPNVVGMGLHGRGTLSRRLSLMARAARWMEDNDACADILGPAASRSRRFRKVPAARSVIVAGSSERMLLPDSCVDLVLTDPPYHDDVQYHELSLPFRAWAGLKTERLNGEAVAIPHAAALKSHKEYRGVLTAIFTEMRRVLKSDGRLLFSYANREPAAWVNVFAALRNSGFRPLGYTIVHSENEEDHLKRRGGRSCKLDLILELVADGPSAIKQWRPMAIFNTDEERFLLAIGDAFLQSGEMFNGWESELVKQVRSDIFVQRSDGKSDHKADATAELAKAQRGAGI